MSKWNPNPLTWQFRPCLELKPFPLTFFAIISHHTAYTAASECSPNKPSNKSPPPPSPSMALNPIFPPNPVSTLPHPQHQTNFSSLDLKSQSFSVMWDLRPAWSILLGHQLLEGRTPFSSISSPPHRTKSRDFPNSQTPVTFDEWINWKWTTVTPKVSVDVPNSQSLITKCSASLATTPLPHSQLLLDADGV